MLCSILSSKPTLLADLAQTSAKNAQIDAVLHSSSLVLVCLCIYQTLKFKKGLINDLPAHKK